MENKRYFVEISDNIEIYYDKQSDILYVYFDPDEQPSEEILGESGDIVFGFKDNKLVVIQLLGLRNRIEEF